MVCIAQVDEQRAEKSAAHLSNAVWDDLTPGKAPQNGLSKT